jgi:hypothetical protein
MPFDANPLILAGRIAMDYREDAEGSEAPAGYDDPEGYDDPAESETDRQNRRLTARNMKKKPRGRTLWDLFRG